METCRLCCQAYLKIQVKLSTDLAAAHTEAFQRRLDEIELSARRRARAEHDIAELAKGIVKGCSFTP